MALALLDTNILIDNLNGHAAAALEILNYEDIIISSISWMEVACKMNGEARRRFQSFLDGADIKIVHPNDAIMHLAATIRGNSMLTPPKLPLPDCIIRATAETSGRLVITRNPIDFGGEGALVRVPYGIVEGQAINVKPPPP